MRGEAAGVDTHHRSVRSLSAGGPSSWRSSLPGAVNGISLELSQPCCQALLVRPVRHGAATIAANAGKNEVLVEPRVQVFARFQQRRSTCAGPFSPSVMPAFPASPSTPVWLPGPEEMSPVPHFCNGRAVGSDDIFAVAISAAPPGEVALDRSAQASCLHDPPGNDAAERSRIPRPRPPSRFRKLPFDFYLKLVLKQHKVKFSHKK